jgi:hypothetical protein
MGNGERDFLLLIDLRGSSKLAPESATRTLEVIEGRIRSLNRELASSLKVDLSLSYGDEVAGIFNTPKHLHKVVREIRDSIRSIEGPEKETSKKSKDVQLRFVAVEGRMGADSPDVTKVGGEIFKRGAHLMDRAKKERRFCRVSLGKGKVDHALASLAEASNTLIEDMTILQYSVYRGLEKGLTQRMIADDLGRTEQVISRAKSSGHARVVIEAHEAIDDLLREYSQIWLSS